MACSTIAGTRDRRSYSRTISPAGALSSPRNQSGGISATASSSTSELIFIGDQITVEITSTLREGLANRGTSDQGERVSKANQDDCGAVDAKGAVEADSQCRVSSLPRWQGHRKHGSARRCHRLTAVFRLKGGCGLDG